MAGDDSREPDRPTSPRRAVLAAMGLVVVGAASAAVGAFLGYDPVPRQLPRPLNKTVTFPDLDGSDDDASGVIKAFLAQSTGRAELLGNYMLDEEIVVPHNVHSLVLLAGSTLTVRGDHPGITRAGSITFRETTRSTMSADSDQIEVRTPTLYSVGEHLLLSGMDVVSGSLDRYGYLRRVVDIDGTTVRVDRPLPRTISAAPRTSSVKLAPAFTISGRGTITSSDPGAMFSALVRLIAVKSPNVTGITITQSGATGITVSHCLGGSVDCTISDLLDDGKKHFGYGVNVSGSTRDLRVSGTISRVRHAVTTNAGMRIDGVGNAGEPENCHFAPQAIDCTNKSIDTHRLGWGTVIVPHVVRGNGGVQIRSDNATVEGGSVVGCHGPGVFVSSKVAVATRIENVTIADLKAGQTGLWAKGPAHVIHPSIRLTRGSGIVLSDDSSVAGGEIVGNPDQGLVVNGSNNDVSDLRIGPDVKQGLVEHGPDTSNTLTLIAS
jgi:hypothetical protein